MRNAGRLSRQAATCALVALEALPASTADDVAAVLDRGSVVHRGGAADQRELSAEARRVNVAGVLTPTPRLRSVTGGCLLVDGVATTGATLTEGVRALAEGGVDVHGVALLCATP